MSFCVSVRFDVWETHVEDFQAAVTGQAQASLEEDGCSRFDVWTDEREPTCFYLYEVYDDRAAFDVHLSTPHFASFDAKIADWVTAKRVETYGAALVEGQSQ
ncbi:MAG: putative quinol monooxygenase [Pseudomonadota bacterium]